MPPPSVEAPLAVEPQMGSLALTLTPFSLVASPSHSSHSGLSSQGGLELWGQLPGAAGRAGPLHGVSVPRLPRPV